MAVREIKTSIALDGEKEFKQAIADINRNMRVMSADLKATEAEYKATGDAQLYYSKKSQNLREQLALQQDAIDEMRTALQKSKETYQGVGPKVDEWRIKLSNAIAKQNQLKKSLADTDREAEEFGRDSKKVGRQIEDGIGDGAEEANRSVKDLIESLQQDVGSIKGSMAFQVASTVTQGVVNVVQSVAGFVDSNRDYRRAMAQFEQAAKDGGYNKDAMQDMLFSLAAFTSDFDGAREALTLMMQTGLNEDWIKTATDIFSYASLIFNGSLDIQGLAEDFQETVASGEVQGKLDEYLNRVGGKKDELEKIMSDVDSTEEKAIAALTYMAQEGYTDTLNQYNKRTEAIQNAEKAKLKLEQAEAKLADELEPLMTRFAEWEANFVDAAANAVNGLKEFLEGNENWIFGEGGTTEKWIDETNKAIEEYQNATGTTGPIENPITTWFKSLFGGGDAEKAGESDGKTYANAFGAAAADALDADTLEMALENLQAAWTLGGEEEAQKRLEQMGFTAEQKQQLIDEMGKLGLDMSSSLDTSMTEGLSGAASNAKISGQNMGTQLANGLAFGLSGAYNTAVEYFNAINSLLSGLGGMPVFGLTAGGYYNGLSGGNSRISVTVPLSINGREVARAALTDINSMQGSRANRASRLG